MLHIISMYLSPECRGISEAQSQRTGGWSEVMKVLIFIYLRPYSLQGKNTSKIQCKIMYSWITLQCKISVWRTWSLWKNWLQIMLKNTTSWVAIMDINGSEDNKHSFVTDFWHFWWHFLNILFTSKIHKKYNERWCPPEYKF